MGLTPPLHAFSSDLSAFYHDQLQSLSLPHTYYPPLTFTIITMIAMLTTDFVMSSLSPTSTSCFIIPSPMFSVLYSSSHALSSPFPLPLSLPLSTVLPIFSIPSYYIQKTPMFVATPCRRIASNCPLVSPCHVLRSRSQSWSKLSSLLLGFLPCLSEQCLGWWAWLRLGCRWLQQQHIFW
jgi:hypothetical protein